MIVGTHCWLLYSYNISMMVHWFPNRTPQEVIDWLQPPFNQFTQNSHRDRKCEGRQVGWLIVKAGKLVRQTDRQTVGRVDRRLQLFCCLFAQILHSQRELWCYCFRQPHSPPPLSITRKTQKTHTITSIIHPVHQSYLNTSSKRAVLSVSELAVGRQEEKQTGTVCLLAHASTIIRCGCMSTHTNAYVCTVNTHRHIIIAPWIPELHFL